MKRKPFLIIVGILLLLIITNPSVTAFKNYLGHTGYGGLKRSANLFVLSKYKYNNNDYIGFFGNFWKIDKPIRPINPDSAKMDSTLSDSAKMDTIR